MCSFYLQPAVILTSQPTVHDARREIVLYRDKRAWPAVLRLHPSVDADRTVSAVCYVAEDESDAVY